MNIHFPWLKYANNLFVKDLFVTYANIILYGLKLTLTLISSIYDWSMPQSIFLFTQ